jgi:hypothetical protein
MYSTTEVSTQENTVVTHEAIQKYIYIYTSILSTYAICTTFKWYLSTRQHGFTSKKTIIFVITAIRTVIHLIWCSEFLKPL